MGIEYKDYQVVLVNPFNGRMVNIDRCMEKEIKMLWSKGIRTIECCCGHGDAGYIAVYEEHVEGMKILGYKRLINPFCPDAENFFYPLYL